MSESKDQRRLGGKYLTFSLSAERYGLQILKVHEIIGIMHITVVPQSPSYMKGVLNLRGKIIPVVDLRLKLGLEPMPYDQKTCIIVVECRLGEKRQSVGIVVDTVLEVVAFDDERIEPSPEYGTGLDTSCIIGMGRSADDQVIILIDIEQALFDGAGVLAGVGTPGEATTVATSA